MSYRVRLQWERTTVGGTRLDVRVWVTTVDIDGVVGPVFGPSVGVEEGERLGE